MFAIITPGAHYGGDCRADEIRGACYLHNDLVRHCFITPWRTCSGAAGWLFKLGAVDFAGGNVVHISSGISALVLTLLLGKRKNFREGDISSAQCALTSFWAQRSLWFGWFGFNAGSALGANPLASHAFMTTNTAAAAAMLSWLLIEVIRNGKPTLVGASTGLVIGLVAITPGAGFVPMWAAIIIGALVSPICYFFISVVKPKFKV